MRMTCTHIHALTLKDENITKLVNEIREYLKIHLKDLKKDGYTIGKLEMKYEEEFYK